MTVTVGCVLSGTIGRLEFCGTVYFLFHCVELYIEGRNEDVKAPLRKGDLQIIIRCFLPTEDRGTFLVVH